jgi:hypothetical protein
MISRIYKFFPQFYILLPFLSAFWSLISIKKSVNRAGSLPVSSIFTLRPFFEIFLSKIDKSFDGNLPRSILFLPDEDIFLTLFRIKLGLESIIIIGDFFMIFLGAAGTLINVIFILIWNYFALSAFQHFNIGRKLFQSLSLEI